MPTDSADDSIIDVTNQFGKLPNVTRRDTAEGQAVTIALPGGGSYTYLENYEPPSLAKFYREKLNLTPRQVSWLNRFPLPSNTFLDIEAGREATVRLYLGVLPLLEQQLRAEGSTLAQTVKTLDSRAKSLRYYASTAWYYTPPKTGADTYLAVFRLCENAVRERLGYKRKVGGLFGGALAELEPTFRELLGGRVQALLPPLLALLPPPSSETELLLNEQNPSRWKTELAQLTTQLAADPPALAAALTALAARNARNPALGALYQEATRQLAARHREAALAFHLRYLHAQQARFGEARPLPRALQKQLFPQPEQAARFQVLVNELALYKKLDDTLAKVPTVYVQPRKKIALDMGEVAAARRQHTGTVELLNEYLRDEPAPAAAPKATKAPRAAKAPKAPKAAKPTKLTPAKPAAGQFAVPLTPTQQALLALFAGRALTLPQAEVEAFARQHGSLRNQLLDGLNEACYTLLDDVLVEESGDDYTIYAAYYQRLIN